MGTKGRDASVAASVDSNVSRVTPTVSYSRSKGAYIGVSLEGQVIAVRDDANAAFYGEKATPVQILKGKVAAPDNEDYKAICKILDSYCEGAAGAEDDKKEEEGAGKKGDAVAL